MWIPQVVVRESMEKRKQEGGAAKKKKDDSDRVTRMTVMIPCIKGI